ncbi:MAG: hypothetical protein MUC35_01470 [Candidatus Margulisbacteria bacterium]|jgi:hypothetical protein|nr:hypothetical protein [Candidatus Margulisiibacteriota bacterium]
MRTCTWLLVICCLCLLSLSATGAEQTFYRPSYSLTIQPDYPPRTGDKIALKIRINGPAQKATVYTDREREIPLRYRGGYWLGEFTIPADYQEGWHFFTVWYRYIHFSYGRFEPYWTKSVVWYRVVKPPVVTGEAEFIPPFDVTREEPLLTVSGEPVTVLTPSTEALPFIIKGAKTLAFTSRSIEGSKEGFVPGLTREEGLRLNIAGQNDDLKVDANLISTSTAGLPTVAQQEDKVSLLVQQGSTEVYLGDYTADLTETEFSRLDRVMSGARFKGEYGNYGIQAFYSSPKGTAKYFRVYGDGTQGPFQLGSAPVAIDSERVIVDGQLQKRGNDYNIDYNAGTVTFIKKTIDPRSIVEAYYDNRQNVYQHATYGVRLTDRPRPDLKLGLTYLDDSDSLSGAADIRATMSQEAVNPAGHYVVGVDGALVSEQLTANGEIAYSRQNLNLFGPGSEEAGKAAKLEISTQLGPFGLTAAAKRVGARFAPIGDPEPKQDVTAGGGTLSFRPGSLFGAQGSYSQDKYTQSGIVYDNTYRAAKASLTPERLPSLEYNYSQDEQSNDPVSGATIARRISRDSVETVYRPGVLAISLKGTKEEWLVRSPSAEATDYRRANFGLATVGLEKLTLTSNVELEDRTLPDGTAPQRRTYNLNLAWSPARQYFLAASVEHLDDTLDGLKNVTDMSYRAEPSAAVRTDGKYTITTVNENYATTEVVSKQTGSFSLDLRPVRPLRLRYLFKPDFTVIPRTGTLSRSNEQQQGEINLLPTNDLALGCLLKSGRLFNIDNFRYDLKANTADTDSVLYTVKLAPLRFLSVELNYQLDNGRTTQLTSAEPVTYLPGRTGATRFDTVARTSLSERFAFDARYTFLYGTQGTGEAADNLADSVSHTASLKGTWNVNDAWSFSLSTALSQTTDNLAVVPLSYAVAPAAGFIFRAGDRVRVDGDLSYSKSFQGAATELFDLALKGKYSLSEFVNFTIRAERQVSFAPDYRLTDISGNLEINL